MSHSSTIIYTKTDEAPALATASLLPIVSAFIAKGAIDIETADISLAARILANFSERLKADQRIDDDLKKLGELATKPQANIVKLPNISASIPQLKATIAELRAKNYDIPLYPDEPESTEEKKIHAIYSKVLGSAVNPVLREGNSDRRVAPPVKKYAQAHPHRLGAWDKESKTHVAHMSKGDFYANEKSVIIENDDILEIKFKSNAKEERVLKGDIKVSKGDVIDASFMSAKELQVFLKDEVKKSKDEDVLLSVHLKATMMKVSDPIIFGHAVKAFFANFFESHKDVINKLGLNPNNGLAELIKSIEAHEDDKQRRELLLAIQNDLDNGPRLAMVDSDKGITNLHVPSDVIIDASMPAMIKNSGKMWDKDGKLYDTKAIIPDRSYAGVYAQTIKFCKENGAFDVATMGNVSNVGLMAKKAQEYGSHDKTFEIVEKGEITIRSSKGESLLSFEVEAGDIWRMCCTKDVAIKDWVKLGVTRAKATSSPAVFWLESNRAHDRNLIQKVENYLSEHDTNDLDIKILSPVEATSYTLERVKSGVDTISVTGNVLRDYLTDLFPILELGTSAKMLSIVPLLAGGGLYETGAGGSAPKHVQQFIEENHLRWDSLGEFLALQVSIEELSEKTNNNKGMVIARALDTANSMWLDNNKSPSRKVGELDNRGSHFYLTLYWAQALSEQNDNDELKEVFTGLYESLKKHEEVIINELNAVQGNVVDIKGYYWPDSEALEKHMRPSKTFNNIINSF